MRHRRAISRAARCLATTLGALLAAACSDITLPDATELAESDLLFLAVQPTAPAVPAATFWIPNAAPTARRLQHADAFNTLFAEVTVPAGALASVDGVPVGAGDSVLVTLQAMSGAYGLRILPEGLRFTTGARPWIRFSYARYGDLSVAEGVFTSRTAFAQALRLWAEIDAGLWEREGASSAGGADVVEGPIARGGRIVAAAPR